MKVFLSHSNHAEDAHLIELLRFGFKVAGVPLYIAERDKQPGEAFRGKLVPMIESSDAVLVLYTIHAASSKTVLWEIGQAGKKPVVFITEWGAKKPAPFEGVEDIQLDQANPQLALCDAVMHFSLKGNVQPEQPRLIGVIVDSEVPNIQYRISHHNVTNVALNPEYVQAQPMCKQCQLLLHNDHDLRWPSFFCQACGNTKIFANQEPTLRARTISAYVKNWKPNVE